MNPILPPDEPSAKKVILHLIREELKGHKFFGGLRAIGLDDDFYQPDLIELIIAGIGLPPLSQKRYLFYHNLFKKHSAHITHDADTLQREAQLIYDTLTQYKLSHQVKSTIKKKIAP